MPQIKRRNLATATIFLVFVIFLLHPGRFSVIFVTSAPQDMLNKARATFCDSSGLGDVKIADIKLLNEIQQFGTGNVSELRHRAVCCVWGTRDPSTFSSLFI